MITYNNNIDYHNIIYVRIFKTKFDYSMDYTDTSGLFIIVLFVMNMQLMFLMFNITFKTLEIIPLCHL